MLEVISHEALAIWISKIAYGYFNPPQKEIDRIKNELCRIELFEQSKLMSSAKFSGNNRANTKITDNCKV